MHLIRTLLKCDTLEGCRRIQSGHLYLRRLGKLSILFTIAVTLVINDIISWCISTVTFQYSSAKQQFEEVTGSVIYKWTLGWLFDPPKLPNLDSRIITAYNVLNTAQFLFFLFTIIWCLRWVYADSQAEPSKRFSFKQLMLIALITNLLLYFALRGIIFAYLK